MVSMINQAESLAPFLGDGEKSANVDPGNLKHRVF